MRYEDGLARPFLEGLRAGKLTLPKCSECGRFHWQPMSRCPHCRSDAIAWREVEPEGIVYTYSTVRHRFGEESSRDIPYTVALIEIPAAPGVRLIAEIEGVGTIEVGTRVVPVFQDMDAHPRLLYRPLMDLLTEGARFEEGAA